MPKPKYITAINKVAELSPEEKAIGTKISERFVFRTNDYYQSLINWDDPNDPIRRLVIPDAKELNEWGRLDASYEELYTKVPGLEHKYTDTALLLCNDVCGAYCRFCFRKRLFMDENDEVVRDVSKGIDYIRSHPEISNVLLTGGDPLIMSTSKLEPIIQRLREIPHVKIIRLGSKMPAFNPFRILEDPKLHAMFERYSTTEAGRIYVMCHFNHPVEAHPGREARPAVPPRPFGHHHQPDADDPRNQRRPARAERVAERVVLSRSASVLRVPVSAD